jgi:EAL domain-containing protein (putative c-di-GMP-specific phosphodiesterase class I)
LAISGEPTICGFEALVRWRHPEHGMMPPFEFIQLAEETGAIVAIGNWVLLQACKDVKALNPDITVAINCSAVQFARSDVSAAVERALIDTGLEPQRLEIEITETMLMKNDQRTLTQLEAIRRLGVRISLDDFGTGYSSLSYLHTYPVDCIKVDRSFVKTIGTERDAGPIIRAIVAMACELSLTTVAEGVETAEQLAFLQRYGCTAVQGYLFSPPRPAVEAFSKLGQEAWSKAA